MASEREITAIVDTAEDEVVRLSSEAPAPGPIALTRLNMLRAIAREHGAHPDDDFLVRLGESLVQGLSARTLTESLARWVPIVGRLVDTLAEARTTHELGWAAHEHLCAMDPRALAALAPKSNPKATVIDPGSCPDAMLPDGTPNPMLVSAHSAAHWVGIAELEKQLKLSPADDDVLALLGFVYYTSNQLEKAIRLYQRAIEINPTNPQLHYYLGNALFRKGQFPLARDAWERVVALDPTGRLGTNARRRAGAIRKLKA